MDAANQTLILVASLVFWLASFGIVLPYLVYPLMLAVFAALFGKPGGKPETGVEPRLPSVTLIISAFNEEKVIAAKLNNVAALDYPRERLNIVVVSDASSDATDAIVLSAAEDDSRIRLHRQDKQDGKTAGLNAVMPSITTELIVFSDANAMYARNALLELVWPFEDARVGYVVGAALYAPAGESGVTNDVDAEATTKAVGAAHEESVFWHFELWQKAKEAQIDSVVGGDGAIYAIRRQLFWELKADDINDFVNPLQIVAAGYKGAFNGDARCFEEAGDSFEKEFRRKRRIVNRSWRAVLRYVPLISPFKRPLFCLCLAAHKVVRWFGAPLVAIQFLAALALVWMGAGVIYDLAVVAIGGSMAAGLVGWALDKACVNPPRIVSIPYYFYLAIIAAWLGVVDQARGVRHTTWRHVRSD